MLIRIEAVAESGLETTVKEQFDALVVLIRIEAVAESGQESWPTTSR